MTSMSPKGLFGPVDHVKKDNISKRTIETYEDLGKSAILYC